MKVLIPENSKDITLLQYQKFTELQLREDLNPHEFNVRKIQIFTGLKPNEVKLISSADYADILSKIDIALNQECEFEAIVNIKGIEFGFIPNLDKITAGEFMDLNDNQNGVENLHKVMAVLFRPIKKKDTFGNYEIHPYLGTEENAEIMKLMPMNAVTGAMVFFSNLANELVSYTQKYFNQEQPKVNPQITFKSGVGMQRLTQWLRAKFGTMIK
jgi:hypothetical protein